MKQAKHKSIRKTFEDANILTATIEHNGFQGGDAGHGGYVRLTLQNDSSTWMLLNGQEADKIEIEVMGDAERRTLLQALKMFVEELEEEEQDLPNLDSFINKEVHYLDDFLRSNGWILVEHQDPSQRAWNDYNKYRSIIAIIYTPRHSTDQEYHVFTINQSDSIYIPSLPNPKIKGGLDKYLKLPSLEDIQKKDEDF